MASSDSSGTPTALTGDAATTAVTDRVQVVVNDLAQSVPKGVFAAGAVLWRPVATDPTVREYAVIHRPRYDDWSLAKGKVDPGESIPVTAAREITEETGYEVTLGGLCAQVSYPVGSRQKVIYYFTAEVTGGAFVPNDEVDIIEWLSFADAAERVTHSVDATVLKSADERLATPSTTRLIIVRHAHAFARRTWSGNDDMRPLDKKGLRQTEFLPSLLAPFAPEAVFSAEPDRCTATAGAISRALGLPLTVDRVFGDAGWEDDSTRVMCRIDELIARGGTSVVVSQGVAIPGMLRALTEGSVFARKEFECRKAGVWVVHMRRHRVMALDYFASPLPVK